MLASLGTGLAAGLAGCSGKPIGQNSDGSQGAFDLSMDGGARGSAGARGWPSHRGTPGATGFSATGGPSSTASAGFTAELRDGIEVSRRPPLVGGDAIYGVAKEAEPYERDPVTFALYAYKLSKEDGSEQWRKTVAEYEGQDKFTRLRQIQGGLGPKHLYTLRSENTEEYPHILRALSRSDGTIQWERTFENNGGGVSQPVVRGDTLYLFDSAQVVALDTNDGSERWRSKEILYDQILPSAGANGVAVYNVGIGEADGRRQLTVLEPDTGAIRWSVELPYAQTPIPTVAGDTVYLADGDALGQYGLSPGADLPRRKIHALSMQDGSERWTHTYETDAIDEAYAAGGTAFVTVTPNHVYYGLGFLSAREILGPQATPDQIERIRPQIYHGPNVVALDRPTGNVAWRQTLGDQARVFRPMVAGPDNLYAMHWDVEDPEEQSQIFVLDRQDGTVKGSFGPVNYDRSFAVADGSVYTHTDHGIRVWR
ncbi:PQQ-binding-like beta-propeller repeat protein [Halobacteriales archaeon Cl-PHB]